MDSLKAFFDTCRDKVLEKRIHSYLLRTVHLVRDRVQICISLRFSTDKLVDSTLMRTKAKDGFRSDVYVKIFCQGTEDKSTKTILDYLNLNAE